MSLGTFAMFRAHRVMVEVARTKQRAEVVVLPAVENEEMPVRICRRGGAGGAPAVSLVQRERHDLLGCAVHAVVHNGRLDEQPADALLAGAFHAAVEPVELY